MRCQELMKTIVSKRTEYRCQADSDLFWTKSFQSADYIAGHDVLACEVPSRCVAQLNDGRSEVDATGGNGGWLDRSDRALRGQINAVGSRFPAWHGCFAPVLGQRGESLAESGPDSLLGQIEQKCRRAPQQQRQACY